MTKQFIKIGKERIRISTIKRYKEVGDDSIRIQYSVSKDNPNAIVYSGLTNREQYNIIKTLDTILGVD